MAQAQHRMVTTPGRTGAIVLALQCSLSATL
jgi:hypothetical protein